MLMVRIEIDDKFSDFIGVVCPFLRRVDYIHFLDIIDSFFVVTKCRSPPIILIF